MVNIRKSDHRGDTLVEVLIAMAIVSIVLVGGFTIANRSFRQIRMAEERSEAQKVAQRSLEVIDELTKTTGVVIPATPFCVRFTATLAVSTAPADCVTGIYTTAVQKISTYNYSVMVTWPGQDGRPQQVTYYYRIVGN